MNEYLYVDLVDNMLDHDELLGETAQLLAARRQATRLSHKTEGTTSSRNKSSNTLCLVLNPFHLSIAQILIRP